MKKVVFDELKAHLKDVQEELDVPFARKKYLFNCMMGLIDHFMTAVKDQWEDDNPSEESFQSIIARQHKEMSDRYEETRQKHLLDRVAALEEKVSDLTTVKDYDNSLHLSCPKCGLFDLVLRKQAKEWKCPRCEVKV